MNIQIKYLKYGDAFVIENKGYKSECILKHKKPHKNLVQLITNTGTFLKNGEETVELIPRDKPFSKGGWICKCLNIHPCTVKMCINCGNISNPFQFNTLTKKSLKESWTCFCGKKNKCHSECKCGLTRFTSGKKQRAHRHKMLKINLDTIKRNTDN